jgi:uncharacterized RDD family membrane protein YckC
MDSNNPYMAPREDVRNNAFMQNASGGIDASKGQRFANLIVDYIAVVFGSGLVGGIIGFVGALAGASEIVKPLAQILGFGMWLGYYILLEGTTGRTLGKLVTKTKVVDAGGGDVTLGQCVKRTLIRMVPFEPFSCLSDQGGWHDRWSNTRVVQL